MTAEQIAKLPKWAQADIKETEGRAEMLYALRWPSQPKPSPVNVVTEVEKLRTEDGPSRLFIGWGYHTYNDTFRITQGCSNGYSHSPDRTDRTSSQGGGRFYHTRGEAILATRWELCERFAKCLARLDAFERGAQ